MKKKKLLMGAGAAGAVVVLGALVLFGSLDLFASNALTANFYDKNGKLIPSTLTVVTTGSGTVEGVSSMNFVLSVKNTGEVPLALSLESASPAAFTSSLPGTTQNAGPGETVAWTGVQIPVLQFEGQNVEFSARVRGTYSYAGTQKTIHKDASLSFGFEPDPVAGMEVTLGSSVGDEGMGSGPGGLTSGTACTQSSECASNSCVAQTYTTAGEGSNSQTPNIRYHLCANTCTGCIGSVGSSSAPNGISYHIAVGSTITCTTSLSACA